VSRNDPSRSSSTGDAARVVLTLDDSALERLADLVAERLARTLSTSSTEDRWLDAKGAAEYLGLSVDALHKRTATRGIPFTQDAPGGKCWFRRSELDRWRAG
jgi:excisionase family DNA binding protein